MTKQPIFRMARKSIAAHVWINLRLCIVFAVAAIMVGLFTSFNYSVDRQIDARVSNALSANVLWGTEEIDVRQELGVDAEQLVGLKMYDLKQVFDLPGNTLQESVTGSHIDLVWRDERHEYTAVSTSSKDVQRDYVWAFAGDPFTSADVGEMASCFDGAPLYYGRLPVLPSEVMVSQDFLHNYRLAWQDVMGEQLALLRNGTDNELCRLTVCGVISSQYYKLVGHSYLGRQILPTLVLSADVEHNFLPQEAARDINIYILSSWPDRSYNDWQEFAEQHPDLNFSGVWQSAHLSTLSNMKSIVTQVYVLIGGIVILGLVLFVMLMLDKFVTIFCRSGGIALSCGLRQGNLYALLAAQIALMFLISLPLSAAGCALGYWGINALVQAATGISMPSTLGEALMFSAVGAALSAAVSALFFGVTMLQLRNTSVKHLLGAEVA